VTVEGDRTYLYGVPYFYGYPYFPMMFVSFEPFRQIVGNYNAMRWGNLALYAASLGLIAALCRRLLAAEAREAGTLLAVLAFVSVRAWANELFHEGVTDLVIAVYGLAGFLAMTHRRPVLSGVLFGLAFASKLLPGPMWFALGAMWWWRHGGTAGLGAVRGGVRGHVGGDHRAVRGGASRGVHFGDDFLFHDEPGRGGQHVAVVFSARGAAAAAAAGGGGRDRGVAGEVCAAGEAGGGGRDAVCVPDVRRFHCV
jgi:hypothetical protein